VNYVKKALFQGWGSTAGEVAILSNEGEGFRADARPEPVLISALNEYERESRCASIGIPARID